VGRNGEKHFLLPIHEMGVRLEMAVLLLAWLILSQLGKYMWSIKLVGLDG
jgi:hypothetical protein